jgi:hypothetical protein
MAPRLPALIVVATALVAPQVAGQGADSSAFTRVVPGETLRLAGVMRLAEVFRLVDDWDATTQDEFYWDAAPAGGAVDPGWLLMIDGQRSELELFGSPSLARIPVPLELIDRIEFVRTPKVTGGELASAGVIHIHTREPPPGLSAGGWATTGSEIGDPGPFAFTPLATPNVDRLGNDGSGRVAYRRGTWYAEATLQVAKQNPTDPAIFDRYSAASRGEVRLRSSLLAPTVRLGVRRRGGVHTLSLRHSRARDFLPLEPAAGELAVTERYTQVGLDGSWGTRQPRTLRYFASWTRNQAEPRGAGLPVPFSWRTRTIGAGAEWLQVWTAARLTVGARLRHLTAETSQPLDDSRLITAAGYGELVPAAGHLPRIAAEVSTTDGDLGAAVAISRSWRPARGAAVELSASYSTRGPATENSVWSWTDRGYSLLRDAGVVATVTGPVGRRGTLGFDLGTSVTTSAWSSLRVEWFWRRHTGLTLVERALALDAADRSFEGPATAVTDGAGQVAGGLVTVEARVARFSSRLSYRLQEAVAGDDQFRAALDQVPHHTLRAALTLTAAPGLDLWTMMEYRSPSRWREFEAIEAATGGAYQARVPAWAGLDVAVQKWLWRRRLRAHLGFRNLLGADVRYHPAGSIVGPRMYVQVEGAVH